MSTLISFLGKGRADRKTGYRTPTTASTPALHAACRSSALALTDYLKPDRLVLVGTAGSMWDVFFERAGADDDAMLRTDGAVEAGQVDDRLLDLPRLQLAAHSASRSTAC
ncbi:hypothetical protein [Candidatus Accumulibacter contiguus]|uniref:hypothetical protein n=1 Tax=Candidatus Accumulibacter contiguus TaxID=2954381 RepID=UPI002FC34539